MSLTAPCQQDDGDTMQHQPTSQRQDLLNALSQVQNHPAFHNVDIMTITGCGMTDDEVRAHIEACMVRIANFNFEQAQQPARKSRRA